MLPHHIVFDLDGTLIDSVPVIRDIINGMLRDRGSDLSVAYQDVRPYVSVGGETMMQALMGSAGGDPVEDIREFRRIYAEIPTPIDSPYPGMQQVIASLSLAGHSLSICSNKPQALCDKIVRDMGMEDRFELVLGRDTAIPHKPDPALFDLVLSKINTTKEQCCYIGDSEIDLEFARNSEVSFIYAAYGYGDHSKIDAGTIQIRNLPDLLSLR